MGEREGRKAFRQVNPVGKLQVRNRLSAVDAWRLALPGKMRRTGKVARKCPGL